MQPDRAAACSLLVTLLFFTSANAQDAAKPEASKPDGVIDLKFDDLKFEIAKGAKFERKMLGEKIEALNGKQVRISGFINPVSVFKQEGIKTLIVTREKIDVNRGPTTPIYEAIRVQMEGDATTKFTTKQIVVEGEFEIREWANIDGRPMAVYHIKATSAK